LRAIHRRISSIRRFASRAPGRRGAVTIRRVIPSDPRTWSDFRTPKQYGFEKVDCDTTLETAWSSGAAALAFTALWLAFEIHVHSPAHAARSGHPYLPMSLG